MFFSIRLKRRIKAIVVDYLYFSAKFTAFMFWASLYLMVMRMTIFKSSSNTPLVKDWSVEPDNYTKWLGPVIPEEEPEPETNKAEWQEPDNETIANLNQRISTVQRVCRVHNLSNQTVNNNEFFVDHVHGLVWCNIFKAASTFWLHRFNILGGYSKKFLRRTRDIPLTLARKKFPAPSIEDLTDAISTPGVVSLIVVRDPFVRLLSAYRDKLEHPPPYYRSLAKTITENRNNASKNILEKRRGPTFHEFVAYLIEKHKDDGDKSTFNEHWTPYYKFCSPCAVNFSVVAKVESLSRDYSFVVHQLGLGHLLSNKVKDRRGSLRSILNKSKDGLNTSMLVKRYFSQLDKSMLDDLFAIYGIDFDMFDYDRKVYYSYVQK